MHFFTNSEIKAFVSCRQKHQWQYNEGGTGITKYSGNGGSRARELGSVVHEGLDGYHRQSAAQETAPLDLALALATARAGDSADLADTATEILRGYDAFYRANPVQGEIIGVEVPFAIQLHPDVVLTGKIDAVVRNTDGTLSVFEHKTAASVDDRYFMRLLVDFQIRLYAVALSRDLRFRSDPETPAVVRSCYYNVLCSKPPCQPSVLKNGALSVKHGIATTPEIYRAKMSELGIPEEGEYAELLQRLDQQGSKPFYQRREYLYRQQDVASFWDMILRITREMADGSFIYKNTTECSSFSGCEYLELCGGDRAVSEYYQKEQRHNELAGVDIRQLLSYDTGATGLSDLEAAFPVPPPSPVYPAAPSSFI